MPKLQVVVTGDKKIDRMIRKLTKQGPEVTKQVRKAVTDSQKDALKPVLAETRQLVPIKTGELSLSYKIAASKRSRKNIGRAVRTKPQGISFYGVMIEKGTKERFHKSGKSVGVIKERRFMREAAKRKKTHALRIFNDAVGKRIEALWR